MTKWDFSQKWKTAIKKKIILHKKFASNLSYQQQYSSSNAWSTRSQNGSNVKQQRWLPKCRHLQADTFKYFCVQTFKFKLHLLHFLSDAYLTSSVYLRLNTSNLIAEQTDQACTHNRKKIYYSRIIRIFTIIFCATSASFHLDRFRVILNVLFAKNDNYSGYKKRYYINSSQMWTSSIYKKFCHFVKACSAKQLQSCSPSP